MTNISDFNRLGEELEKILLLKTSPVAVRMLKDEAEIPEGAVRPRRDRGYHLAQCQAFGLSRRDRTTVAMLKEDNWCPAPVMAYGLVPLPEDPNARRMNNYDCFEQGKYIGILTAPLRSAAFEPEVVMVYSDTNQLRILLLAMKSEDRPLVGGHYFPPSCAWAVTTPMVTGEYRVVLPDPGEYVRAATTAGEMIFAIPARRLEGLVADLREYDKNESGFAHESPMMRPDFPQPDLYKRIFESWGMEHE